MLIPQHFQVFLRKEGGNARCGGEEEGEGEASLCPPDQTLYPPYNVSAEVYLRAVS